MRWRRILNEQTVLLLLAFLISVTVWTYVNAGRTVIVPQTTTKVVPIIPAIVGEPAYGYTLLGIRITPQTVVASGDPKVLAGLETVTTESVNIAGLTHDFTQQVTVVTSAQVRISGRVRVSVQIAPAVAVTTVRGIRVQVPRGPAGMVVEVVPDRVQVEVQGPITVVYRLRASDFSARVDGLDFAEARQRLQVKVQGPSQVEVLTITPPAVTATVRKGG